MTSAPALTSENRLVHETSPYLLQHKHNPVDWWAWGPPALAEAQRTNRPILLSVGYAACHWCHVMAHESFEDDATAQVMNELFVNIKVDREERPDIDQIYMSALHHLGEHGGWPLTMFLKPTGEPFWGGTYFPKTARYGKPAFVDVLREVERVFRQEPKSVEQNSSALMARLSESARSAGKVVIGVPELNRTASQIGGMIDPVNGGMRGAPKFPQPMMLEFLWRAGRRTNDPRYFAAVQLSLARMCEGGIYDHLGGGFSRYSVDDRWLTPHFEKMLYDNALLLELLTLAWQHSAIDLFRARARETVTWLEREMTTPEGAFSASLDADSEGEEGKFYVWSLAEVIRVLGESDAAFFAANYDVTTEGNFEGHNILNRLKHLPRSIEDEARLAPLRAKLLETRAHRVRPGLDDKVLADWNGLMIAALANASYGLRRAHLAAACGQGFHVHRRSHGTRGPAGSLLAGRQAAIPRPRVRPRRDDPRRVGAARSHRRERLSRTRAGLAGHARPSLRQPGNGGYFLTADDAEGLVVRPSATTDDATPNPNALAAQNLVRLAALTGQHAWRDQADRLFDGILASAGENVFGHLALLNALDLRLRGAEIVIVGEGTPADDLLAAARRLPFLDRVVLHAPSADALAPSHPAQDKIKAATSAAAFICVGEICSLPVTRPDEIAAAVAAMRG